MASAHAPQTADRGRPRRLTLAACRNPMARRADRVEATVRLTAFGIWWLCLPALAVAAAVIWGTLAASYQHQGHDLRSTNAELLVGTPAGSVSEYGVAIAVTVPAQARWDAPDGSGRIGTIRAPAAAKPGDHVPIWVDANGAIAEPPTDTTAVGLLVIVGSVTAWLVLGTLLFAAFQTVRWRLNRRRLAGWDQEWAAIEPLWTGR